MDCEDSLTGYGQDLLKFLYCLRILVRDTYAVAFITVPSHLFDVSLLFCLTILLQDANALPVKLFLHIYLIEGFKCYANNIYFKYKNSYHRMLIFVVEIFNNNIPGLCELVR